MSTEEIVRTASIGLAYFAEAIGALIVAVAVLRALTAFVRDFYRHYSGPMIAIPKEEIRLGLGRSLALALEFLLGADILRTAVAPTWNDVGLLAAVAALRTALNYFLERELRKNRSLPAPEENT